MTLSRGGVTPRRSRRRCLGHHVLLLRRQMTFTHRWTLDQADEAYKLFDKQADGKGVFLI